MKLALPLIAGLLLSSVSGAGNGDPNSVNIRVPGGWSSVSVEDARVKIAAQHAVVAQASNTGTEVTLVSIEDAQRQVVAGMNYKLRLSVIQNGKPQSANATVWARLNGACELTAWTWK